MLRVTDFADSQMQEVAPVYCHLARDALSVMGNFADVDVPTGLFAMWGQDLGWPDWIVDGTSLPSSARLPRRIRLADNLRIMANFLDRFGYATIIEAIFEDFPNSITIAHREQFLAAPDALALLRLLTEMLNTQSPHLHIFLTHNRSGFIFAIGGSAELGPFSAIYENLLAVAWASILCMFYKKFVSISESGLDAPVLHLRSVDPAVSGFWENRCSLGLVNDSAETKLFLPLRVATRANPRHDPEVWNTVFHAIRANVAQGRDFFSRDSLRLQIRQSMMIRRRVPTLDELARESALSKRSIDRILSAAHISYRDVVTETRMELAVELLTNSGKTVEQIARSLGYSGGTSFGRAFRQKFGISPAEWRSETPKEVR